MLTRRAVRRAKGCAGVRANFKFTLTFEFGRSAEIFVSFFVVIKLILKVRIVLEKVTEWRILVVRDARQRNIECRP